LKGWFPLSLLLALIGFFLLWNGINERFDCVDASTRQSGFGSAKSGRSPVDMVLTEEPPDTASDWDSLSLDEALIHEKLILGHRSVDSTEIILRYRELLLETLADAGWDDEDISLVKLYLADDRSEFLPYVLEKNSTHKETGELYSHQLTSISVNKCMEFQRDAGVDIADVAGKYGVPPEVVISILKVETDFGINKGKNPIFNIYGSLSVADHPEVLKEALGEENEAGEEQKRRLLKRARWARSQLHELVALVSDSAGEWILWVNGSWAGAFGLPQFIPSSYRAYSRDGDNDDMIDLDNVSDAAASIAYYLKSNGWRRNISRSRMKKVILRYNYSTPYAECVLALADSMKHRVGRMKDKE